MFNTISGRDLQKTPKKVMKQANRIDKPLVIITENKPVGAVIGLELLRILNAILAHMDKAYLIDKATEKKIEKALKDIKDGKSTLLETDEDIEKHFKSL